MNNTQEIASNIKSCAKDKKIAIGKMLSDCRLSKNTLSSMLSGGCMPSLETIILIANYLDISIDYLVGRTDIREVNRSSESNSGNPSVK